MSVLGPRGRVRLAFVVLIVAVGSLAAVLAQDRQSVSTEVFRLNARHLEDGRVEVAVERFTPASRYLPANHPVGEWLISEMFVIPVSTPGALADQPAAGVVRTSTPLHQFNVASISPDTRMVIGDDGDWTYWIAPRDGGDHVYVICTAGSGVVHAMEGGGGWSVVTERQLMSMLTDTRWENAHQEIADGVRSTCGMSIDPALVTQPAVQQEKQVASGGPPDWNLNEPATGMATGHWTSAGPVIGQSVEEGGGWMVWQMYRAGGPDAYVACRPESGVLHAKAHGGDWSTTAAQGLVDLFSFAPWHKSASLVSDIGSKCGVPVGTIVSSLIPRTTTEPQQRAGGGGAEPQPDPRREVPVVSGLITVSDFQSSKLHGPDRILIQWDSRYPRNWTAKIRILNPKDSRGRLVLAPGTIPVSVGGRTFNFVVPEHSSDRRHGSMVNRVWSVGTEAKLSGADARDFYCAAKGGTVNFSVTMNSPRETKAVTIHVREIAAGDGIDLCE